MPGALKSNVIPLPYSTGNQERYPAPGGGTRYPSSFGAAETTFGVSNEHLGSGYNANEYFAGERAMELDWRARFYSGRQHDWRPYDQNGRMQGPRERGGFVGQQAMLGSSESPTYVPMGVRRPNVPYRIPRVIVKEFTGLLFGQSRWPAIISDDPDSQAFAEEIIKAAHFNNRFHRARNIAGACGVAMMSWFFAAGRPRIRVHNGRFVTVLEWDDVDDLKPAHVTELYQTHATRRTKDGPERYTVWVRRDWTPQADVVFKPIEVTGQNPEQWVVDEERTVIHQDGFCHCVWLPNFSNDEDPSTTDGVADYDTLEEAMTAIDELNSLLVRGVGRNIDPTLVLKVERQLVKMGIVQKGSDNALAVGESGDARYLTLEAGVVEAGKTLLEMLRQQTLEGAQCVVPDPDKVVAAGTSSVAMKMMYALTLNAADLLREPFGQGIINLCDQMQTSAKRRMGTADQQPEIEDLVVEVEAKPEPNEIEDGVILENDELEPDEQEPEARPVEYYFDLPDRVVVEPVLDEQGRPTSKSIQRLVPIRPGNGTYTLRWPEYFPLTAADKQANATALSTAAGGKPVLSQRTATELAAALYDADPQQETERMAAERFNDHQEEQGMFPPIGGPVDPGMSSMPTAPDGGGEPLVTPSDMAAIVLVNEARAASNPPLGPLMTPDGQPDPDGLLTVAGFRAKMEAMGNAVGEEVFGKVPEPGPVAPQPAEDESFPMPPEEPAFPVSDE